MSLRELESMGSKYFPDIPQKPRTILPRKGPARTVLDAFHMMKTEAYVSTSKDWKNCLARDWVGLIKKKLFWERN